MKTRLLRKLRKNYAWRWGGEENGFVLLLIEYNSPNSIKVAQKIGKTSYDAIRYILESYSPFELYVKYMKKCWKRANIKEGRDLYKNIMGSEAK